MILHNPKAEFLILWVSSYFILTLYGIAMAWSRRVAQLVYALPSVLEVPSSILSDSNVCSDFSLICVALALNTRKMEHWQREGVKGAPLASTENSSVNWRIKETFTFIIKTFAANYCTVQDCENRNANILNIDIHIQLLDKNFEFQESNNLTPFWRVY